VTYPKVIRSEDVWMGSAVVGVAVNGYVVRNGPLRDIRDSVVSSQK